MRCLLGRGSPSVVCATGNPGAVGSETEAWGVVSDADAVIAGGGGSGTRICTGIGTADARPDTSSDPPSRDAIAASSVPVSPFSVDVSPSSDSEPGIPVVGEPPISALNQKSANGTDALVDGAFAKPVAPGAGAIVSASRAAKTSDLPVQGAVGADVSAGTGRYVAAEAATPEKRSGIIYLLCLSA